MKFKTSIVIILLEVSLGCGRNALEDKKQTIQFEYIAWSCACANWAEPAEAMKYHDSTNKLSDHCVFIEAARDKLKLPDTLGYNGDIIEFTGQFYKNKGYAKGYVKMEEPLDPARIFRYTSYKVIECHYKEFKVYLQK